MQAYANNRLYSEFDKVFDQWISNYECTVCTVHKDYIILDQKEIELNDVEIISYFIVSKATFDFEDGDKLDYFIGGIINIRSENDDILSFYEKSFSYSWMDESYPDAVLDITMLSETSAILSFHDTMYFDGDVIKNESFYYINDESINYINQIEIHNEKYFQSDIDLAVTTRHKTRISDIKSNDYTILYKVVESSSEKEYVYYEEYRIDKNEIKLLKTYTQDAFEEAFGI
ncbi:MAG: hypothetical protein Kapaf2KO_16130 [Candidatus Kapaibacteriales bacterium]